MRAAVRHLIVSVGILVTCLPLSIVGTLLMFPVWRWVEATYGIEAVGHSGPAEWCYVATFLASTLTALLLYALRFARAR